MLAFIRSTYFQGLLDSFQTGVILFNDAGRAYAVNDALPGLLGTSREHLSRSTWDAFFLLLGLNEDLNEYLDAAGPLDRPKPLEPVDFDYEHPDGRTLRLSLTRSLLVDYDKLFGITVQVSDMTGLHDLHEREKRMLEENRLLQRHRAQGLQKLSMAVAHQIRNPLMTVGGFSDLLLRKLPQSSVEAGLVAPILDSARRLEAVVGAVSAFAAVRVDRVRNASLARLAREALEQAAALLPSQAAKAKLTTPEEGAAVPADPELLRRALFELTRNSLEAANGHCAMTLRLAQDAESWIVEFADNGPGVAEEHRPYIFDPFYSTRPLSIGMGLPMAERICQEHGGAMNLSCPPEGGCVARLYLPRDLRTSEHVSP